MKTINEFKPSWDQELMLLGVKWQTDGGALPIINLLHAGMSLAQKFAFFQVRFQFNTLQFSIVLTLEIPQKGC